VSQIRGFAVWGLQLAVIPSISPASRQLVAKQ
jgi:hypothetical protein